MERITVVCSYALVVRVVHTIVQQELAKAVGCSAAGPVLPPRLAIRAGLRGHEAAAPRAGQAAQMI